MGSLRRSAQDIKLKQVVGRQFFFFFFDTGSPLQSPKIAFDTHQLDEVYP